MTLAGVAVAMASPAAPGKAPREITFFVASDSHFGADGMVDVNRVLIDHMNALPATDYPPDVGGRVEVPRGVLVTGDLTDNGHLDEFALFEQHYGLTGQDGRLRFPVFEAIGNHDVNGTSPIKERAKVRHGGINYSWDWEGVHFACLDMYPDAATRAWLEADLRALARGRPVIVFFHYALEGRLSHGWDGADKDAFAEVLAEHNVLAVFHGHTHRDGFYQWRGWPVFRPGAPRHSAHTFLVARVEADRLVVAARDFDAGQWLWTRAVPVRRAARDLLRR
jgi:cytolysin (calcineurin-like family phosphatase)